MGLGILRLVIYKHKSTMQGYTRVIQQNYKHPAGLSALYHFLFDL